MAFLSLSLELGWLCFGNDHFYSSVAVGPKMHCLSSSLQYQYPLLSSTFRCRVMSRLQSVNPSLFTVVRQKNVYVEEMLVGRTWVEFEISRKICFNEFLPFDLNLNHFVSILTRCRTRESNTVETAYKVAICPRGNLLYMRIYLITDLKLLGKGVFGH